MDSGIYVGLGLIIAGALIFLLGRGRSKRTDVRASHGSVAVGGNNAGQINNINVGQSSQAHGGGHAITILAAIVELVGIAVTVWHAMHSAAK